jgi:3-deoxy-manno-octulosonate cytidylyltransferase (CMP-KDO synthetase)
MKAVLIIPARYKSTRFPGKALYDILGKSLIYRTWSRCLNVVPRDSVYIATDDERIRQHCIENGMQYIMTSEDCLTGTDRVAEAYNNLNKEYDIIINVQGDEPLIDSEEVLKILDEHKKNDGYICCGVAKIRSEAEFRSPNIIKIIMNGDNELLYASRAAIPTNKKLGFEWAYKQICVYTFSPESLKEFASKKEKTPLEKIEDVEFLRFLEMGYKVKMVEVSGESMQVDVPEDVLNVVKALIERKMI